MGKISEAFKAFWKRLGEEDVPDYTSVELPQELKKPIRAEAIYATSGASSGGMNQYIVNKKPVAVKQEKGKSNKTQKVEEQEQEI